MFTTPSRHGTGKIQGQVLWIFLHLSICPYVFLSAVGQKVTCQMPSVQEGQPASLTCHFGEDVSSSTATLLVKRYIGNTTQTEDVLDCYWPDSGIEYSCDVGLDGFAFDDQISSTLTVTLNKAGPDDEGRYLCQKLPDKPSECVFELKEQSDSGPSDAADENVELIIGVVVGVLAVVVVVVVVLILWRRKRSSS